MIRVANTENGLVKGIEAADPRITAFKEYPLQHRQLRKTDGEHHNHAMIGREP